MENILLIIHTMVAIALVGVVLLQRSEGGALGMGGGGGGGGGGMLSSRAAANLLTRATAGLAVVFFLTSIALTVIHSGSSSSIADRITPVGPASDSAVEAPLDVAPPAVGPAGEEPATLDEPLVPRPE
ncbi:preprotein translocase subunit SecG [Pyruvatibacter sp.]|uniref:preprotein translocase subunit SecG n=1 Tax=Pyruvatibacter sp. TaxID=1981328 RepID=UPI0032EABA30